MKPLVAACLLAFCATPALAQNVPASFIGCPADGQTGPGAAPAARPTPQLPTAAAKALAYYAGPNLGVLAPRGWHCAEAYGASGVFLLVTEQPLTPAALLSTLNVTGPAVQLSVADGETSGRFEVAHVAARLFPAASAFVASVKAENQAPASDFATTPYSGDTITRHGPYEADFVTPPHQRGLGTASLLVPSNLPVHGIAMLLPDNGGFSLVTLAIRLPAQSAALTDLIANTARAAASR
jgi:hypothetical protein